MKNFKSEQTLYREVSRRLEENFDLTTDTEELNGRRLYLVGEMHGSLDPIDYVHKNIVPLIKENPTQWLLLREGLNAFPLGKEKMLALVPHHFYFVALPKILGIPADDAIKTITAREVKDYIIENSRLTEEEIDAWYLTCSLQMNPSEYQNQTIEAVARKLEKSMDYIEGLMPNICRRDVHETLMMKWNQFGRKKLTEILETNPNRDRILVSCGTAHLSAFSDKYSYIG